MSSMEKLIRLKTKSRAEWLRARKNGIGASESGVIAGVSTFMTVNELWNLKTGNSEAKEISGNEFVAKGIKLEPYLRNLFKALHDELKVTHHPYDMLFQSDRPHIFATLDGEIKDGKRMGVLEIKTSTPNGKTGWDKWNERIPDNYYTQICHQLNATGYDFAILFALLFRRDGDMAVREYRFEREGCLEDMEWLLKKEDEFWQSVQNGTIPPTTILF